MIVVKKAKDGWEKKRNKKEQRKGVGLGEEIDEKMKKMKEVKRVRFCGCVYIYQMKDKKTKESNRNEFLGEWGVKMSRFIGQQRCKLQGMRLIVKGHMGK